MLKRHRIVLTVVVAACALLAFPGSALTVPVVPTPQLAPPDAQAETAGQPDAYGTTATTVVKIHAPAFRSQDSSDVMVAFWNTGITYRQSGDPIHMLHAPVQLPAGALVTQVGFDGYDVDPTLNINWGVYWVSISNADDTGYFAWYTSSQSGGSFSATATLSVPYTVDAGNYYFALLELPENGQDVRIKGMRIVYKLQISPAPASATFSDVPTNYWAFRHIEALAASGITSGCAAGLFCPETYVKRSEMAVFLAKALGLHWPN